MVALKNHVSSCSRENRIYSINEIVECVIEGFNILYKLLK
ncbi:hypothetical protein HMPREF1585_00848 [Gardnerella vaginalis JCP8481B]|nr:hypothetical protein HMPREF1585_00848 [Gardnerella vaginalis JCP8481B]